MSIFDSGIPLLIDLRRVRGPLAIGWQRLHDELLASQCENVLFLLDDTPPNSGSRTKWIHEMKRQDALKFITKCINSPETIIADNYALWCWEVTFSNKKPLNG